MHVMGSNKLKEKSGSEHQGEHAENRLNFSAGWTGGPV
jgi:hypothetical protein